MRVWNRILFSAVILPFGLNDCLRAQAVGEMLGTVQDPSGAVVPQATITVVQNGTGFVRSTLTGSAGTYSITALPVGSYSVKAEATGFKSASSDITLDVNQKREVNFTLALEGTTSEVRVAAAAELLNTTTSSLEGLVTGQQVASLPLNGRDITNLVLLQPGVNQEVNSMMFGAQSWSGNGNRAQTGASYLDGIDSTDAEGGGATFTGFNLDAIAEFKVLQNNYSAEYGRGGGTIVQLATKTGTNAPHGSLFEFVRNSAFDSRNFFSSSVPPFRRNEYGLTFGGPLLVPKVYNGKDRTFVFFQWAAFRQRRGAPIFLQVPTADDRKGIVDIIGANGKPDKLIVPINSISQYVASHYPLPNEPSSSSGPRTYNIQYSIPENHDQYSGRVDHRFSDHDTMFFRYSLLDNEQPISDPYVGILDPAFSTVVASRYRNLGFSETHIFSPTLLNIFRFGWDLTNWFFQPGNHSIPQTTFSDGSLSNWGPDTFVLNMHQHNFVFNDGINWTKGRHTMSVGFEYRRVRDNVVGSSTGGPNGTFVFSPGTPLPFRIPSASGQNDLAAGTPSPSSLISFLAGAPGFYFRSLAYPGFGPPGGGFPPFGVRRYHANGWFQDDFRVNGKLTVNLGLRWEFNSVPYEQANRFTGIVDDPHFKGGSLYRRLVLNPDPLYYPDYRGFGPRTGFAYKVADRTVLRGGFGIFTNLPPTVFPEQAGAGFPFASQSSQANPQYSMTPLPVSGLPVLTDLNGNPVLRNNDTKTIAPNTPVDLRPVQAFFGGPILVNYTTLHFRNGYTMSGNFTLEQQVPGDAVLQIGYVFNNAAKLYASEWPNAYTGAPPSETPYTNATPGLGEFQLTDNHAHSSYNSLQLSLRKVSASHGVQFQLSYTRSKALDNASTVWNGPTTNSALLMNDPTCFRCERGPSVFDVPQRFVLNVGYQLPFGRISHLPKRLTNGWLLSGIASAQSGFPFTVNSPYGTKEYGTDTYLGFQPTRPDLVQTPTYRQAGDPEEQLFSTAVVTDGTTIGQKYFATPGASANGLQDHPGNLGRNTFRAPSWSDVDLSLIKDTLINERVTVQFRSEFFNALNQHGFGWPGAVLGSRTFGISNYTVFPERQIQLALRLIY